MADLISREAAIDAIVSVTAFPDEDYIKNLCQNPANSEDWLGGVCDAINAVEDVIAVDAVPVVHGRWMRFLTIYWKCSECGYTTSHCDGWLYCPHCGAKMDGERRDDNETGDD